MEIQVFGVLVVLFGMLTLNMSYQWSIYALITFALFPAAAAINLSAIGVGFPPMTLFLAFFALRAFNLGGGETLMKPLRSGRPGFWFACLCVWVIIGAILLPRALAGSTYVFAMDRSALDPNAPGLRPLGPVSGNLTQSMYYTAELVLYCCTAVFVTRKGCFGHIAKAFMLGTAIDVLAAVVEIASHAVNVDVLHFVKTANYAMLDGSELGGLMRITGTFPESSSYSACTVPLFAFTASLWLLGYKTRINALLALGSGLMLMLSTSATAYVGFAGYLAVLLLSRTEKVAPRSRARKLRLCVVMASFGVMAAIYAVLFRPDVIDALGDFFQATILNKANSSSGVERSNFNTQALQNFVDTFGLGVGMGTVRASSFIVVLAANLGVLGIAGFGVFLWQSLYAPIPRDCPLDDRVICYACRQGMLATLVVTSVSSSSCDPGPFFFMFAAASVGLPIVARRRAAAARHAAGPLAQAGGLIAQQPGAAPALPGERQPSRVPAWPRSWRDVAGEGQQ
ncbi:O-antigen ligase family protein [Paraburkholderia caballeronis]|uniref:O-Antigen ligase n=1 Tax=Paraburkholderia caballeronis TaxID=416943 RepID=A0A1H7JW69_9BURK|nr:O-antigen ligase family protein [Paraburkholderia caballeronis]PXW27240.1 hypothetical protein C7403_103148 [Paraburkholderia caballeronis]PXX02714.1 hypothetical protein C7407_103148 [Paraburkholderia caballeronis]RAK03439.1 hypothetical protein C7409_103148 [Paraburkholderia caballeronis]SEC40716.1 hypothetical protein SAMN05445871_2167 [Paraburkholderia caballeronis]SEK78858.1 hypothetical protein SAMN05192542_103470 [Paraburkholderia caballeronis]